MMARLVVLALVLFVAAAFARVAPKWHELTENYSYDEYLTHFSHDYPRSDVSRVARQNIFKANLLNILKHNADNTQTWKAGVNHFTDLTEEEFRVRLGYNNAAGFSSSLEKEWVPSAEWDEQVLPGFVDWREKDIISSVKDQGDCGSCWTFGSTETVESHYALKTGKLPVLSEQQILDCTPNPKDCGGTGGCKGGTSELAYDTIAKMDGHASEWTYPYISYFGVNQSCPAEGAKVLKPAVKISGFTRLPRNKYLPVLQALAFVGPLAINVDASHWGAYETGVFSNCSFNKDIDIDHVVQLVGYGTEVINGLSVNYWLIRNSWAPVYGEDGYIKVLRTETEESRCGYDTSPLDGTACKGNTRRELACGTCGVLFGSTFPTFD